jgi:hypothetical protein
MNTINFGKEVYHCQGCFAVAELDCDRIVHHLNCPFHNNRGNNYMERSSSIASVFEIGIKKVFIK